jgi:hypothetical protein
MKTSEQWPSTKALSVWNALRIARRAMTPAELVGILRRGMGDPEVNEEYVVTGIGFLIARGSAEMVGPVVVANAQIGELIRTDEDRELEPAHLGVRRARPPMLTGVDSRKGR